MHRATKNSVSTATLRSLAPAGDVEQLARHCLTLQSDPAFAAELGENGRRFILNYTWDGVIDRLEREFLRSSPPASCAVGNRLMASGGRQPPDSSAHDSLQGTDSEYPDLQLSDDPRSIARWLSQPSTTPSWRSR